MLTIKDEFGKTLVQCSQNTLNDDRFILSKAARIMRRFLFEKDEVFHCDLLKESKNHQFFYHF